MRKMKHSIVESKEIFVGVEIAKKSWRLCIRSNKMIIRMVNIPGNADAFIKFIRKFFPDCKVHAIYEAGYSGFGLHDRLTAVGIDCVVTPPNKVTVERGQRVKNETVDARRLAKVLECGDFRSCHVPDQQLREHRQVSRMLERIKRQIIAHKNYIRKTIEFHGYDTCVPIGRWHESDYTLLPQHLPFDRMSQQLVYCFNLMIEHLQELRVMKASLLKQLRQLRKDPRYTKAITLIESCPGIGWYTATRLVLEWGADLSRFGSGKKFASFLGLTGCEHSTGEQERKGHITKQGPYSPRGWLVECAWMAIKKDQVLLGMFNRVWKNAASKKKAIVAVARKLAVRIRTVVITEIPYSIGVVE